MTLPAKLPLTKKVSRNRLIACAATTFAHSSQCAVWQAQAGQRESARWWGAEARQDWRTLHALLTE